MGQVPLSSEGFGNVRREGGWWAVLGLELRPGWAASSSRGTGHWPGLGLAGMHTQQSSGSDTWPQVAKQE